MDERVTVLLAATKMGRPETTVYDPAAIREKYGLEPSQLIDLKALMGDASDHIPGSAGVGEKTALELMHRFGSLDALYEQLDSPEIRPAVRRKLEDGRDSAYLSRELGTICREAPVDPDPEAYRLAPVQKGRPWPGCWPGWNFSLRSKNGAGCRCSRGGGGKGSCDFEAGRGCVSLLHDGGTGRPLFPGGDRGGEPGRPDRLLGGEAGGKRGRTGGFLCAGGTEYPPCWPGWPTPPWR